MNLGGIISAALTNPLGLLQGVVGGAAGGIGDAIDGVGKSNDAQPGSPLKFGEDKSASQVGISF